ncbi:MAG: MYG1 family protein [Verrucomicrobiota bacterium]
MPFVVPIERIVTHPGSAHKDEVLACAVCLAVHPVVIERRDPSMEDLEDPSVAVIDVGDRHEPELNNFDHHQFPREQAPTCSLSLVLRALGKYEAARRFCSWLEPTEWFDCRGPKETAEFLGVPREAIHQLNSPIDLTILRRFADQVRIEPGTTIHSLLTMIGEDLLGYIDGLQQKLAFIEKHSEIWEVVEGVQKRSVLFLPRTDPMPPEPSAGIGLFVEQAGLEGEVSGLVYPDRRGNGYGLSRFNDSPLLDFTRIREESDVHFAHAQGFVAKTSATAEDRLKELIRKSFAGR